MSEYTFTPSTPPPSSAGRPNGMMAAFVENLKANPGVSYEYPVIFKSGFSAHKAPGVTYTTRQQKDAEGNKTGIKVWGIYNPPTA